MDNFDFFRNLNKLSETINKVSNPLNLSQWMHKNNTQNTLEDLMSSISIQSNLYLDSLPTALNWQNYFLYNELNNYNDIFDKIRTIGYWGDLIKTSIAHKAIYNLNIESSDERIEDLEENIDALNNNIEQIESNPLEFFNSIFLFVKEYMDKNPSIKYSSMFISSLILLAIPILLDKVINDTEPPISIQVTNNLTNHYINEPIKINRNSIFIKSLPRQDAKDVFQIYKDDELEILKENRIWVLVIKINTAYSGWIKKENLNLVREK